MRVADGHHQLTDTQPVGVADRCRDEIVSRGADHRDIGERVLADHHKGQLATVGGVR